MEELINEALEIGISEVIQKPFDMNQILKIIDEIGGNN